MINSTAAIAALRALIGPDDLISADDGPSKAQEIAPLLVDQLQRYRGRALAVVTPRSVQDVVRVVSWCNEQRVGLVPQGGNTGYCGGATPDDSGQQLLLSLRAKEEPEPKEGAKPAPPKPIVLDRYHFKQDVQGYLTDKKEHLYLFDIATKKQRDRSPSSLDSWCPSWPRRSLR